MKLVSVFRLKMRNPMTKFFLFIKSRRNGVSGFEYLKWFVSPSTWGFAKFNRFLTVGKNGLWSLELAFKISSFNLGHPIALQIHHHLRKRNYTKFSSPTKKIHKIFIKFP